MTDTFHELSDVSRKLNQASDRLNSTISGINSKLGRLNFGLEVWLTHRPIWHNDRQEAWIGYCEIEGEWQLAINRRTCVKSWDGPIEDALEDAIENDYRPLLKVSRELRLDALQLVESLLHEIRRRAEFLVREIGEAEKFGQSL